MFDQLNTLLLNQKEKEQRFNESIKKLNLNNNLLHLINMDKADIICLFNEKENNLISIENKNRALINIKILLQKKKKMN